MNRKMLRLPFVAEATFTQSSKCICSAHYTAVGLVSLSERQGVSSGCLNTITERLSKFLFQLLAFLMLSILRIWFSKKVVYFRKQAFYRDVLERRGYDY